MTAEYDETSALLPPKAASDDATRLLIRARSFLDRGWCQWTLAHTRRGSSVDPTDQRAVAWCAWGALFAAGMPDEADSEHPAICRLMAVIGGQTITGFNNRQATVEPVLAAFDRAIAMSKR